MLRVRTLGRLPGRVRGGLAHARGMPEGRVDRMSIRNRYPLDPRWRALLGPVKRWALLPRSVRLTAVHFRNSGEGDEPGFEGLYVGEGLSLAYYLHLFSGVRQDVRQVAPWRLRETVGAARSRFPVVVVEINALLGFLCPAGGWRSFPWVRHELDLEGKRYQCRERGIEGNFGRVARRGGYQYRMTHRPEDVRRFYHEYYLPHVRARFGSEAAVRGLGQVLRAVRRGFLLQVFDGEDWVSGMVGYRESPERIQLVSDGLRPDRRGSWQDGALSTAFYFTLQWARSQGVRYIDFGGTRPHLDDGVFHHKMLWGAEPLLEPWHHTETRFYVSGRLPRAAARQLVWGKR